MTTHQEIAEAFDPEVFLDDSNNGGYYTKCEACEWQSQRENFRGSAKLRLADHLDKVLPPKPEKHSVWDEPCLDPQGPRHGMIQ